MVWEDFAKAGKVNCIIVKDFSRFGRNYVELGDYLEQYFPFCKCQYKNVVFLENKPVGKPTFLFSIF